MFNTSMLSSGSPVLLATQTSDKMKQLEEEGLKSDSSKCFSCHMKDISITTQPLSSDTTKSR